jgi:CheY-like chemotaxis protein/predicted transcriptional regulator
VVCGLSLWRDRLISTKLVKKGYCMPGDVLETPQTVESEPALSVRQPILLIDTDPSALEYMERALSQTGLSVLATETLNGPDGALALLAARQDIHVIVLDPVALRSGADSGVNELQKQITRPDIELIIVTESRSVSDLDQPWAREAADLLPKPLLRQTWIRAVQEAQRRHASLRDRRAPLGILSREDGTHGALPLRRSQPFREHPVELRILDSLAEIDDLRIRQLDGIVEGDAAWSMLAELLRARLTRRRISVTSLCLASKSPVTTALRRIERLLEGGLVTYSLDPKDRRRKYIELTEEGALRLHAVVGHLSRWLGAEPRNGTTGL